MSAESPSPSYPVRFVWDRGGEEVHVCITASSSGESRTVALVRVKGGHQEAVVKLNVGRFEYR